MLNAASLIVADENSQKQYFVGEIGAFRNTDFPAMITVVSLLQNLTFEDIHAVRTYEKAWALWLTASQTSQEVLIL